MKWKWWIKLLALAPFIILLPIALLGILVVAVLAAINPGEQIARAKEVSLRNTANELVRAVERYYAVNQAYPWGGNSERYYSEDVSKEEWVTVLEKDEELMSGFREQLRENKVEINIIKEEGVYGLLKACFTGLSKKSPKTICVPENIPLDR
jgi:histone acetyltransferase (RNA polymerase elongator complex component)